MAQQPERPSTGTIAFLFVLVILLGAVVTKAKAEDCEYGAFGCGHQFGHDQYQGWTDKAGASCCSGQDCRPVRARTTFDGDWQIWIPELRRWVDVPAKALTAYDRFMDGRSHACTPNPLNWQKIQPSTPLPVYCFSPTGSKS